MRATRRHAKESGSNPAHLAIWHLPNRFWHSFFSSIQTRQALKRLVAAESCLRERKALAMAMLMPTWQWRC